MVKINSKILLIAVIGLAVLLSGCTGGQDVTSVVKALPEVQQFMKEHPNAQITVTYWSKEEVAQSSQEISQQCDKPITPVAMYKATVSEGDLKIVSWINAENQIVMCSTTTGSGGVSPKLTPKSTGQTNKLEIINLDVQQVILNDSEIREVIGFDWNLFFGEKKDSPGNIQGINLEYININSNTKEEKHISSFMMVFPNITATKEGYSKMLLEIGKDVSETDIEIGDTGKVITCKSKGCAGIIFIKNNVIVMISSSSTVNMETMNKLAKRQEDKILGILEGKGGPRLTFTPFPTMIVTQSKNTMPTKEAVAVIGENIVIGAVDGVVNSANTLVGLNITIKVAPRSPDTDLSRLILRVKEYYMYSGYYAGTGNSNTFRVYTLKDPDNGMGAPINSYTGISSPILKAGALARLDIDVSSLNIKAKDSITLSLTPEKGVPLSLTLTLPAFGNEGIVSIYP